MTTIATLYEALEMDGLIHCGLVYWIPIAEPIQVDGRNVVATPASEIPREALRVVPNEALQALDAGRFGFVVGELVRHPEEPEDHFERRVQAEHHARSLAFLACYRDRWGSAVDSTGQSQRADEQRCKTCGEPVTGRRRDSRYCCNACRQSAYRQRLKAA